MKNTLILLLLAVIGYTSEIKAQLPDKPEDIPVWRAEMLASIADFPEPHKSEFEKQMEAALASADEVDRLKRAAELEVTVTRFAMNSTKVDLSQIPVELRFGLGISEEITAEMIMANPKLLTRLAWARKIATVLVGKHAQPLEAELTEGIRKMTVPVDGTRAYRVYISPGLSPNVNVLWAKSVITVNLGVLLWTADLSEVFGVIAHEMTHSNPKHMEFLENEHPLDDLKTDDKTEIRPGVNKGKSQREEIRADIGATDRLVRAGYNPWGIFRFLERLRAAEKATKEAKGENSFTENDILAGVQTHPHTQIRMAAIKTYIASILTKQDLSLLVKVSAEFTPTFKELRKRTRYFAMSTFTLHLLRPKNLVRVSAVIALGFGLYHVGPVMWDSLTNLSFSIPEIPSPPRSFTRGIDRAFELGLGFLFRPSTWLASFTLITSAIIKSNYNHYVRFNTSVISYRDQLSKVEAQARDILARDGGVIESLLVWSRAVQLLVKWENQIKDDLPRTSRLIYSFVGRERHVLRLQAEVFSHIFDSLENGVGRLNAMSSSEKSLFLRKFNLILAKMETYFPNWATLGDYAEIQSELIRFSRLISRVHNRDYDLERDARVDRTARIPGEYLFEYTMRTNRLLARVATETNPDILLNILDAALATQNNALKVEVIRLHYFRLVKHLYRNSDSPALIKGQVFNPSRKIGATGSANSKRAVFEDAVHYYRMQANDGKMPLNGDSLVWFNAAESERDRTNRTSMLTHNEGMVRHEHPVIVSESESLDNYLANQIEDIRELVAFVDRTEKQGGNRDNLKGRVVNTVLKRAELFKSYRDIQLLYSTDYLWVTVTNNYFQDGLEKLMFESMTGYTKSKLRAFDYNIKNAEVLHYRTIEWLKAHRQYPTDGEGLLKLWVMLTNRGVTVYSDALFHEVEKVLPANQRERLEKLALGEGRVWEFEINERLARGRVERKGYVAKIRASPDRHAREKIVHEMLSDLAEICPPQTAAYRSIIEDLAQGIAATEKELALFTEAKKNAVEKSADKQEGSIRILSTLVSKALAWSAQDQFDLIRYLRGDIQQFQKLDELVPILGSKRILRMYQALPLEARAAMVIDPLLADKNGLFQGMKIPVEDHEQGRKIIEYVLRDLDEKNKEISRDLIEAILYGIRAAGNKPFASYLMAYMLSFSGGTVSSPGEILRVVLSRHGPTGIKIAQNIVAAGILDEVENEKLRKVQDQADNPSWKEVYRYLRKYYPYGDLPFVPVRIVGSASMKFAVLLIDVTTGELWIGKFLTDTAVNHTNLEFEQLKYMAEYLARPRFANKYSVLNLITRASRRSVTTERSFPEEARKSDLAATEIYPRVRVEGVEVAVAKDKVMGEGFMLSKIAPGQSFNEFDSDPVFQEQVARAVLAVEDQVLNADKFIIDYDPDRHAGNFKVKRLANGKILITHYDFGQEDKIADRLRKNVTEIFSIARIMADVGATDQLVRWTAGVLEVPESKVAQLKVELAKNFPLKGMNASWAYFTILAAADLVMGETLPVEYVDYVRALNQLQQYERKIKTSAEVISPERRMRKEVEARIAQLRPQLELGLMEQYRYLRTLPWSEAWSLVKEKVSAKLSGVQKAKAPSPSAEVIPVRAAAPTPKPKLVIPLALPTGTDATTLPMRVHPAVIANAAGAGASGKSCADVVSPSN